jgi:hypothetical protein
MPLFSERNNLRPEKIVQINSINKEIEICLWNIFYKFYFPHFNLNELSRDTRDFFHEIWGNFFKKAIDDIDNSPNGFFRSLKKLLITDLHDWWQIYDFIEFVYKIQKDDDTKIKFEIECNKCLKMEMSGYRLINGIVSPITNEIEIAEINKAIDQSSDEVKNHMTQAIILLSDKKNPDYRNSIKESISAVESLCRKITQNNSITLGEALNTIEKRGDLKIHPALIEGFKKIYGWTSGSDGIRHGMIEESNIDFEDANFMLVSCSAFINYLNLKFSKFTIKS